jgi:hypothetical protein
MQGDGNNLGTSFSGQATPPGRTRLIIASVLLAFIIAVAATAWVMTHWQGGGLKINQAVTGQPDFQNGVEAAVTDPAETTSAVGLTGTATTDTLERRMITIEQRLMRVAVAAQSASGYANRAEAIMVAFAARRALDAGAPLGYIEGQLRVLFGEAQPKAVATIINAANEPVTVNKLRAGLADVGELISHGDPNESWWQAATRELGSLVIIRPAGTPSPEPERRLAHARRAVEAGQIDDAIADVVTLPPQPAIGQWLEQARRYNEAHRALDVIEAAAILEPRTAPTIAPPIEAAEEPALAPLAPASPTQP